MHDIYTRLVAEAAGLVKFTRKSTLSAAEFQTASRLILRMYPIDCCETLPVIIGNC